MTLHIHNPEADRLAHELASLTGKPVEDVVLEALRERADHLSAESEKSWEKNPDEWEKKIMQISVRCAALPDLDPRTPDEILYDINGLPY